MTRGLRLALAAAIATALTGSCTEPNPGYRELADGTVSSDIPGTGCTPGQRTCSGQTTMVCARRAGEGVFEAQRTCPGYSSCQGGACFPEGAPCSGACASGLVCTIFISPSGSGQLGTYCAQAVGTKQGGANCSKDADCQSGFCLTRPRGSVCFKACSDSRQCNGTTPRCIDFNVTVDGVPGTIKGCGLLE